MIFHFYVSPRRPNYINRAIYRDLNQNGTLKKSLFPRGRPIPNVSDLPSSIPDPLCPSVSGVCGSWSIRYFSAPPPPRTKTHFLPASATKPHSVYTVRFISDTKTANVHGNRYGSSLRRLLIASIVVITVPVVRRGFIRRDNASGINEKSALS